jgi:hypothetical protein
MHVPLCHPEPRRLPGDGFAGQVRVSYARDSTLLALGRQNERLMNNDDIALYLAGRTHAHTIMSESIPDQAFSA